MEANLNLHDTKKASDFLKILLPLLFSSKKITLKKLFFFKVFLSLGWSQKVSLNFPIGFDQLLSSPILKVLVIFIYFLHCF